MSRRLYSLDFCTGPAMMKSPDQTPEFATAAALLKYFGRKARVYNAFSTLLGLLQVAMTIALAWQVATLLDRAVYQPSSVLPSLQDWLQLAAILLLRALAVWGQGLLGNRASLRIRAALRQFALQRCFGLNIRLFPHFNAAEVSNLLTTEIDKQRGYFADFIPQQRLAGLMPLVILLASAFVSWLVPVILLLTAPLVPLFMVLVGSKAADVSRANLQQLNRLGDLLADRLKNLQALQLAGAVEQEGDRLFEQSEDYRKSTMQVLKLAFLSGTVLEFFSAISVAIVALYLGLFFLDKYDVGSYAAGYGLFDGIFLLMLAPEFYQPLRRMGALYHDRSDAVSVAEHLLQLDSWHRQLAVDSQPHEVAALTSLQLRGVQSGELDKPVHGPVDLELHPGQKVLLNGPSGSGKTTLLDTLAGLRPVLAGALCINGQPASVYRQADWFQQIGYLSQKPELLFATIRENLTLGRTFSDEALWAALSNARVGVLVAALPGQLDYLISDSGGYLSGGQAQRIALARVFLHRPALLLLDEPTANLDQDTAAEFMQQLAVFAADGGMLVMASHRPGERELFDLEISLTKAAAAEALL
ncbi:thiol reductant ABC exporter subunit CydD [Oceanobacter sp. 5_MG-2023]|uniref:thiol reductant ABC exporter subunit CydD n=1 Tax=Oceanobacter sp. 5_MG-2023 TaxID=3062645 RepID=UPI0026E16DA9|nr:thiol reductant ABC exporter subunit CydD [Oceanobacter sp. 5_MG-2023]MDO6682672.1 thiol reductant ABC exporter subunit CydD [Oceanobacter sp. 5_MG-2023]